MSFSRWGYRCLLRLGILVGLLSAVVTVIYLTPIPDLHHASCIRPCHDLDWPMICRFKLVFEHHHTMGGWCGDCPRNVKDCFRPECVLADGQTAKMVAVNKQLPGLNMQVCERDILVVEVENRVAGAALGVHWVGQTQADTPYMDGVPMVTQCPIQPYTTFQYKFRANQHGTHFWKAHTGNELLDNAFGAIIVRRSDRSELTKELYDEDRLEHTLLISEWMNPGASSKQPTILINGISSKMVDLAPSLNVDKGKKYRMRVAFTHSVTSCPVFLSVGDHTMLVIALDGQYISPRNTSTILMAPGERLDFILTANRAINDYSISVESNCTEISGLVKLKYNTSSLNAIQDSSETQLKSYKLSKVLSTVTREMCSSSEAVLCLEHLEAQKKMPSYLETIDTTLFLPFDLIRTAGEAKPRLDNISFILPPSPLLSQPDDMYTSRVICNSKKKPIFCPDTNEICECTHIIDIPLDSKVELVLVDQGSGNNGRVFHLHGYTFYVVGVTSGLETLTPEQVRERHGRGSLFSPPPAKPVRKDTVAVPERGAVALRFKATNPGYWVLHDHSSSFWSEGMNVVFKVGQPSDLPAVPDEFPVCGSWVGPEFFLI